MRHRALAYQGVYWLKDLGLFDTYDAALEALNEEQERYCGQDRQDYEQNSEYFWSNSRIEKLYNNKETI